MKAILLLLIFSFSIQKEVKDNIMLRYDRINLSSEYDYGIYVPDFFTQNRKIFYYYIGTELETFPCDITYRFRGLDNYKNVSIYHEEKKGNFSTYFFKIEKAYEEAITIDFNVTNVKGEQTFLIGTIYEELNSYIVRLENIKEVKEIQIYKNKPLYILFGTEDICLYIYYLVQRIYINTHLKYLYHLITFLKIFFIFAMVLISP